MAEVTFNVAMLRASSINLLIVSMSSDILISLSDLDLDQLLRCFPRWELQSTSNYDEIAAQSRGRFCSYDNMKACIRPSITKVALILPRGSQGIRLD